jgi:TM2 domain-containing membrane protein YozV
LGRKGSAIAMLILSLTIVGLAVTSIWALVDAFLTYKMVNEKNAEVESSVLESLLQRKRGLSSTGIA